MMKAKGFTILEMLVVIMILALMTTIAGVNLQGKERNNLESVAKILMTDLRYVRSRAMVASIDTAITFDVVGKNYFFYDAKISRTLPQKMSIRLTVDEKNIDGTRGKIIFYPDGSSSGGKISLTKDNRELEVSTAWLNGYVTMRRL